MNYETAKLLKDNGFPQKIKYGELFYHPDEGFIPATETMQNKVLNDQCLRFPSLTQLIKACGAVATLKSGRTDRFILWFGGENWHAGYYRFGDELYVDDYPEAETGSTPEEAVARLYLAIHTPKPEQP